MDIAANLDNIRNRMARAAVRAGRDPAGIRLVAVAKTQPTDKIRAALKAGQTLIGENYVQELLNKQQELSGHIDWHFIGRLQSNKVRQIVGRVSMIHSVDRRKLFTEIEKRAAALDCVVDCLLEINVGGEDSKGGAEPAEAAGLLKYAAGLTHVNIRGLMSIPPFLSEAERIRPYHRRLAALAERLRDETGLALEELSMGMSLDFEAAIEEGATLVRVGTDIFGARHYG